jgi:hypothetical protein
MFHRNEPHSITRHQLLTLARSQYGGGLYLGSTATLKTFAGLQLWLHHPIHQGTLTKYPYSSSLAERAAFSLQYFAHQPNQSATRGCSIRSETVALCSVD